MKDRAVNQSVDSDEQSCQVQEFHNISWTMWTPSKISDAGWLMGDAVHEYTAHQKAK